MEKKDKNLVYMKYQCYKDKFFINRIQLKKMDSLMFTFNADQVSTQLELGRKSQDSSSKFFRRRPISSNPSHQEKTRKSSSDNNKLFENSHLSNQTIEDSPEKSFNVPRIKNSSIQIQEKKKLRSIIDNMLGRNFDASNIPKLDSISTSNRKNLNKHRTYLNGARKNELQQRIFEDKECKQNQLNLQNTTGQNHVNASENQQNHKANLNLKLRKFEFATIKINKVNHQSQRYPESSHDDSIDMNYNELNCRRRVNISRESIDRQSLGKKLLKAKTPKIMYPQSDSKLPSVFRAPNNRIIAGDSTKNRKRILSAQFIVDKHGKKSDQSLLIQRKKTLEPHIIPEECNRTNFRPKSTMAEARRFSSSNTQTQPNPNSRFHPQRLLFDCNQELTKDISKKLESTFIQNRNLPIRAGTRTKSTHANYVHRKLREINSLANEISQFSIENKNCTKNESQYSRQTAEESNLQSSTNQTLPNLSNNLVKSIESKEFELGMGLGYSITFQVQKQ